MENEKRNRQPNKDEEFKSPYRTVTEGQLALVHQMANPSKERYPEYTNMQASMVFAIVANMVREKASDPNRDRTKEPLSEVMRIAYCACQRGVGFKMAMLMGNVGLGLKSESSDMDLFNNPRSSSKM